MPPQPQPRPRTAAKVARPLAVRVDTPIPVRAAKVVRAVDAVKAAPEVPVAARAARLPQAGFMPPALWVL